MIGLPLSFIFQPHFVNKNGDEHAPVPLLNVSNGFLQRQRMILNASKRIKRDRAERVSAFSLKPPVGVIRNNPVAN